MKKHRRKKFLDHLKKVPIIQLACEQTGISRQTVYRWKNEDPEFAYYMGEAFEEGEELLNDMVESQLISLIKERNFVAIRYWLSHRHPKFKPEKQNIVPSADVEHDKVVKALGLTDEDFTDEKMGETMRKIYEYIIGPRFP